MLKASLVGLWAVALAGVVASGAVRGKLQSNVVIIGTAQDCFAGAVDPVSGVSISAFRLSAAGPVVAQLDTMRRFVFIDGDSTAVPRFDALMAQLQSRVMTTPALIRTVSASNGSFTLNIPAGDSVLVVGFEDMEDEPWYYSSKSINGMSNSSFVLDMSRGHCGF